MGLADFRMTVLQEGTDPALKWDARIKFNGFKIKNLKHLVEVAERRCEERRAKIYQLNISGHGSSTSFHVGSDYIDLGTINNHLASWLRLKNCLSKDAEINLQQCRTGRDRNLLIVLSAHLGGRSVTGAIWDQGPFSFIQGDQAECWVETGCRYRNGVFNFDDDKEELYARTRDVEQQRNAFMSPEQRAARYRGKSK